jgi:hypothetical protein
VKTLQFVFGEVKQMTSILTEKQMAAIRGFEIPKAETEGLTMCQHCFLSELPGVIFGIVTVVWIIGTLGLLNR